MEGLGEAIEYMLKGFIFLVLVQVPFSIVGLWTCISWLITFIGQHWK